MLRRALGWVLATVILVGGVSPVLAVTAAGNGNATKTVAVKKGKKKGGKKHKKGKKKGGKKHKKGGKKRNAQVAVSFVR
jgi:hypothetical protein